MRLEVLDVIVLLIYMAAMAWMGFYFSKKNNSTEEYFVGGRSFSGWVIGLSLVGTSISSVTFLAYPADSFKTSWIRFIACLALPIGVFIAAYVFLPFFRRQKQGFSAYEYLEDRFGSSIRLYASAAFIIGQLLRVSIILYLVSLLFHEVLGINPKWCIIIAGVCVSLYTIIGGIDAVIWTDVIQTIVLCFGGIITLAVIVGKLPGGFGQIFDIAQEYHKLSAHELIDGKLTPIPWGFSLGQKTILMLFILGLNGWLTEYSGNQSIIQRYFTAKNTHEARKAMLVAVLASLPIWAFYMFLGTALFAFFHVFPCATSTDILDGVSKAEQIFPYFIIEYLPAGLTGLVIASALAASMSSLDSSINSISTSFVMDVYKRFFVKNKNDKHYLHIAWAVATVVAVLMMAGAIILVDVKTKTLQDTANILMGIVGGGLLGIYMLGFFTRCGDYRAVLIGIVCTIAFTIWTVLAKKNLLPENLSIPFDLYYTTLVGNVVMFVTAFISGKILGRKTQLASDLTVWK